MNVLNQIDTQSLWVLGAILSLFIFFYGRTLLGQKKALSKIEASLKLQEQNNQQLIQVVAELRRSNRILGVLAEVDPQEYAEPSSNRSTQNASLYATNVTGDNQFKLYVGNIDYAATEAELAQHFSIFGQIQFVNIPVNKYTGRPRGFGFVTFGSKEEADRAISLHGTEFKGRQIQVNFAKEREVA
jgi:RNA recognition motif-containing protein